MSDETTNDATTAGGAGEARALARALAERCARAIYHSGITADKTPVATIVLKVTGLDLLMVERDALARRLAAAEGANAKLRAAATLAMATAYGLAEQQAMEDRWYEERLATVRAALAADATPANTAIADPAATLNLEEIRNLIGRERDKHKPGPTTYALNNVWDAAKALAAKGEGRT